MEENAGDRFKDNIGKKADWNLALFHFERWGRMFEIGSSLAIGIRSGNLQDIENFFAVESEFIDEWWGMMSREEKKKFGDYQQTILKSLGRTSTDSSGQIMVRKDLPAKVLELWRELHTFQQQKGMGIPMRHDLGEEERLRRANE